ARVAVGLLLLRFVALVEDAVGGFDPIEGAVLFDAPDDEALDVRKLAELEERLVGVGAPPHAALAGVVAGHALALVVVRRRDRDLVEALRSPVVVIHART